MKMRAWRALFVGAAAWMSASMSSSVYVLAATIDPNDKGLPLFPKDHPNITFFTDDNWNDIMKKQNDRPWLVDFYHPFCPHCKHFVPTYEKIAAFYKEDGSIYLGAISCMDHVKCRRIGITGFPTLIAFNFDKSKPGKENDRVIGTHTLEEAKTYVSKLIADGKKNATAAGYVDKDEKKEAPAPTSVATTTEAAKKEEDKKEKDKKDKETKEARPGEQVRTELWEETNATMTQITRLQDAGSAFVFGLKQGVFMGREVLDDFELDALKAWLLMVSQTFPGTINRKLVRQLYESVAKIPLLDFDRWDKLVKTWQARTEADFKNEESALDFSSVEKKVPEWQRLSNIFLGEGNTYRACASYTCGQWMMFHMLALNPAAPNTPSDEVRVSVMTSIRRFMKYFFGCAQCKEHFLASNSINMLRLVASAGNKQQAIQRWMWQTHNAVNKRLWHPQRPKKEECAACGSENDWKSDQVEKWYRETYEYREVAVPVRGIRKQEPERELDLDLDQDAPLPAIGNGNGQPTATSYHPKDAEMGIDHPAHRLHREHDDKAKDRAKQFNAQGFMFHTNMEAPRFTVFAWYLVPILALGAYLWFVRSRKQARRQPRHQSRA